MANRTFHLKIWRQAGPNEPGRFESYTVKDISEHASFLEMLDHLNEQLVREGKEPVQFDSDCREGICGMCGCMVNGMAHGPEPGATICQVHVRSFRDGDTITVEPFRAKAFPVIKDLCVDRSAFDRIIASGGYVSVKGGPHPDANSHLIGKPVLDEAFDAAACIGCGACVAACPNASAHLFTSAKIRHLALLPQGQPERSRRVIRMVDQHDAEGFGNCTNIGECQSVCPKEISIESIRVMKADYLKAVVTEKPATERGGGDG